MKGQAVKGALDLVILIPEATLVREPVMALRAADASGGFGILPGHEPFLTVLAPGLLAFRPAAGGRETFVAVDGGVLRLAGNRVTVTTREAVLAPDLAEIARAARAMLDRRRGVEQAARSEFARLEALLRRELARHVEHRARP